MLRPGTGDSATPRMPLFLEPALPDGGGPPGKGGSNCCSALAGLSAGGDPLGSEGSNGDVGVVFAGVVDADLGCGAQGSALLLGAAAALLGGATAGALGAAVGALGGAAAGVLGAAVGTLAGAGILGAAAGVVLGSVAAGVVGCASVFGGSASVLSGSAAIGVGVAAGSAGWAASWIGGLIFKGPGALAALASLPGIRTKRLGKGCGGSAAGDAVLCDFSCPSSARMRCSMHCKFRNSSSVESGCAVGAAGMEGFTG